MPEMRTLPYDAEKIRDLREQAGLSLKQLGARTGHHPESLRNIERARRNASAVTLARIAIELDVPLSEILREDTQDPQDVPMKVAS